MRSTPEARRDKPKDTQPTPDEAMRSHQYTSGDARNHSAGIARIASSSAAAPIFSRAVPITTVIVHAVGSGRQGSAACRRRLPGDFLDLGPDAQQVPAPDFCDLLFGVA